ncbi:MAG: hypothetical protein ACRENE_24655, partial [Polyangiaceae bacterium]
MTGRGAALARAASAVLALASAACSEGSPASPASGVAASAEAGAQADAGPDGAVYVVCPSDLDASFTSILSTVLSTSSCGTNVSGNCHSTSGASPSGAGNLLDFTLDAGAVYAELLGDGGGATSANIAG